jgi:hypothetical protein
MPDSCLFSSTFQPWWRLQVAYQLIVTRRSAGPDPEALAK